MPSKSFKKMVISPLVYSLLTSNQETGASAKTLKEAADGLGIYMGTAMTVQAMDDQTYMSIIPQEFDLITAENSCKMSLIIKSLGDLNTWFDFGIWWNTLLFQTVWYDGIVYDYEDCDKLFTFAK